MTWFVFALLAAVFYAALWLLVRATRGVPSGVVNAVQNVPGLALLAYTLPGVDLPWHSPTWIAYLLVCCVLLPILLFGMTHAAQTVDVSVAKPLTGLSAVSALVFSMVVFNTPFTKWGIAGVLLTASGLFALYHGRWHVWKRWHPWMILFGVLCFGLSASMMNAVLKEFPYPMLLTAIFLSSICVVNSLMAARTWRRVQWTKTVVLTLVALAIVNMLQEVFTTYALQLSSAPYALSVKRMSIILTAVGGYYFFGEREQSLPRLMLASGLVVAGVAVLLLLG